MSTNDTKQLDIHMGKKWSLILASFTKLIQNRSWMLT